MLHTGPILLTQLCQKLHSDSLRWLLLEFNQTIDVGVFASERHTEVNYSSQQNYCFHNSIIEGGYSIDTIANFQERKSYMESITDEVIQHKTGTHKAIK